MVLSPGARVWAERDVYGAVRICVPRGTLGTVEEIRDYGTVVVRFDNGRRVGVSDSFLTGERPVGAGGR